MEIKVLGPGCAKCHKTEEVVLEAVKESGVDAQVIKITDAMEIANPGSSARPRLSWTARSRPWAKFPARPMCSAGSISEESVKCLGDCCASNGNIMILPCSGGSNTGQLANRAAVELTREGFGKMYCLAGIGGRLSGFVESAKGVEQMMVIDGCDLACGKATLEGAGVPLKNYLVVTDLGIEKNKDFDLKPEELEMVKHAVKLSFKTPVKVSVGRPLSPSACPGREDEAAVAAADFYNPEGGLNSRLGPLTPQGEACGKRSNLVLGPGRASFLTAGILYIF